MKNIILGIATSILLLSACNSGTKTTQNNTTTDSAPTAMADTASKPAGETATPSILSAYLQLKNALTKDNDKDAAEAGKILVQALTSVDKAALTDAQSKVFGDIFDDAKEHAEHIGANAGNIKHQREHFETLSRDIYDLVKAGGTMDQKLYYDHCPMYNDGKGGNWISETKEIQNPYLGKAMPDCGSVKEELN